MPLVLAPAPFSSWGWQLGPYEVSWSTQTARFLQQHASKCEEVPFNHPQVLSEYEARQLLKVSGVGMNRTILTEKAQRLLGILLTLISILFVISRLHYAGALWRDEAGALRMALMPSVSDIAGDF